MEEKEEIIEDEIIEDSESEEIDDTEEGEEEFEVIEKDEKEEDLVEKEIEELKQKIKEINGSSTENRFPRSETKTDFASGIINTLETKKIANLQQDEIYDLIEKRKFYNFLKHFGWNSLGDRVICNVRDVEDYSLSNSGKLLDSVFIDKTRNEAKNIQEERRSKT